MADLDDLRSRLDELRAWADAYKATDFGRACSIRSLAYELNELVTQYEWEVAGRRAMQANYERCLAVIGRRGYGEADVEPIPVPTREEEANPLL